MPGTEDEHTGNSGTAGDHINILAEHALNVLAEVRCRGCGDRLAANSQGHCRSCGSTHCPFCWQASHAWKDACFSLVEECPHLFAALSELTGDKWEISPFWDLEIPYLPEATEVTVPSSDQLAEAFGDLLPVLNAYSVLSEPPDESALLDLLLQQIAVSSDAIPVATVDWSINPGPGNFDQGTDYFASDAEVIRTAIESLLLGLNDGFRKIAGGAEPAQHPPAPDTSILVTPVWMPIAAWGTIGRRTRQFEDPHGVAVDAFGCIYVTDAGIEATRIHKLLPDGTPVAQWGAEGPGGSSFPHAAAIAVGDRGYVYVVDSLKHRVHMLSRTGNLLAQWGSYGQGQGEFDGPQGIALDSHSCIYVVDAWNYRVQKLSPDGQPLCAWGRQGDGPGEFGFPTGIAVGRDDAVYVADGGYHRIQKFSPDGELLATWGCKGGGAGQFVQPQDLALDSQGRVYVADLGNHRIQIISPIGAPLAAFGSEGVNPGQFVHPRAIALDASDHIYVVDACYRVQKFPAWPQ